ncbi:MAG: hypothetical protein Q7S71_01125 [Candidatus Nitrotoga sp.]|nr:hypothetical protein [Candidatus Nitrotoga sp.]
MSNRISRNFRNFFLTVVAICGNVCLPAPAFSQSDIGIVFRDKDQIVKTLTLSDLATVAPAVSLKIFEIHEKKERIYKAYPARALFDKAFGKEWQKAEEIVFLSMDGYQASIPVTKFLSHDAYFAFALDENSPF